MGSNSRAGKGDGVHREGESLSEGAEGWLYYLIIEAWIALYINIFTAWRDNKFNVRLVYSSYKIPGLFFSVKSMI